MRNHLVQEHRLEHKMTQTLLQSIQLLQYSSIELIDYIKGLANENPLIEEIRFDHDVNQYRTMDVSIGEINPTKDSMYTQLKNQMYLVSVPDRIHSVVEYGIDSLNKEGYLDIELEQWAEILNIPINDVEEALSYIQQLDPVGVGARTLNECLYLQLRYKVNFPDLKLLLYDDLDLIAENKIETIADRYEMNAKDVSDFIDKVKTCHPHPGLFLETGPPEYILPEANIVKREGKWDISFYNWNNPSIVIDESYDNLLDIKGKTSEYLKEKYQQIEWLNQAISYRTSTLELVIKVILSKQHLFFEHGEFMLKPLTLRDVAKDLDLSISTVSRAISRKYIQTTQGIFPLKFFFQSGLNQRDGQTISTHTVKKLILEAIKFEDKVKPLSDEALKNKLSDEFGIVIARRTVMKYRNQLNIVSSTKRK